MDMPRRFFGLARNVEGGGSVTIIGTILVDTGSRMDEVIFEELKATGNSEIVLDRGLAQAYIFPAINIALATAENVSTRRTPSCVRALRRGWRPCAREAMVKLLGGWRSATIGAAGAMRSPPNPPSENPPGDESTGRLERCPVNGAFHGAARLSPPREAQFCSPIRSWSGGPAPNAASRRACLSGMHLFSREPACVLRNLTLSRASAYETED
jgi:hypothetical protein